LTAPGCHTEHVGYLETWYKEVRKSPYWQQKEKKSRDKVWRDERIKFAANKHVKDKARRSTLLASSKHMLDVYQALNRAHERGDLNQVKARQALTEMLIFLEDWANSIGL
jgi:hypothetical protein